MKSILMSIQPKWVEKIISGEKTIEVRKTAPKPPFKVYVYCTKGENLYLDYECMPSWSGGFHINENNSADYYNDQLLNGKIIGEFVCDYVEKEAVAFTEICNFGRLYHCRLSLAELKKYAGKRTSLYYWHISALKVYDKPRELGEFGKYCIDYGKDLPFCNCHCSSECYKAITRPPQSWQYVEEEEE